MADLSGPPQRWPEVEVVSTKWTGDFHRRTRSYELGTEDAGTWLWMPPGLIADTPTGPYQAIPGLRLIPIGQPWSAVPSTPAGAVPDSVYIDITTPNRRNGAVIEFIDLDLDVTQTGNGPVEVLDRDEFDAHARDWNYPPDLIAAAEETCAEIVDRLTTRQPPFDGSYLPWSALVT